MRNVIASDGGNGERVLKALSPRERDIGRLLCAGMLNKEIAAELGLAESYVRSCVCRMLAELEVRNRVELTRLLLDRPAALNGAAIPPGWTAPL